jgi:hypothetical protein
MKFRVTRLDDMLVSGAYFSGLIEIFATQAHQSKAGTTATKNRPDTTTAGRMLLSTCDAMAATTKTYTQNETTMRFGASFRINVLTPNPAITATENGMA